jgi:hypothetical protein
MNKVILRAAIRPDATDWRESWLQNRVDKTVALAYQELTWEQPSNRSLSEKFWGIELNPIRMSSLLSQAILFWDEKAFIAEYKTYIWQLENNGISDKKEQQNLAVEHYLAWEMEGGNALRDIHSTAKFFSRTITRFFIPYINGIKSSQNATNTNIEVSLWVVRHGEKLNSNEWERLSGQLTEDWENEAKSAGDKMKGINNLHGIIWVQQPHNQMMMLALEAWKTDATDPKELWSNLPDEWKLPYETWEVTERKLWVKAESLSKSTLDESDITITVSRNNHNQAYNFTDLLSYTQKDPNNFK